MEMVVVNRELRANAFKSTVTCPIASSVLNLLLYNLISGLLKAAINLLFLHREILIDTTMKNDLRRTLWGDQKSPKVDSENPKE